MVARFFSLGMIGLLSLACDALVPTSYRGEPRLSLDVGVVNREVIGEDIVPALARVNDAAVRFRGVAFTSEFGARFRMELHDAPGADALAPVDPFLAPDVLVAREYIGVVLKPQLATPIALEAQLGPIHRNCWNGGCDVMLGQATALGLCAADDEPCRMRHQACRDGVCRLVLAAAALPEGAQDIAGFASDYLVLYLPEPVATRSWAALRLGAPEGLPSGYHHLAKVATASAEARLAADDCMETAHSEALERFSAEHPVSYDGRALSCLRGTGIFCEHLQLPSGAAAKKLASAVAAAELEHGCLQLAPDFAIVSDSTDEQISIRVGDGPPAVLPAVPLALAPFVGEDTDTSCLGPITVPVAGTVDKPLPAFQLLRYGGALCPEGSLELAQHGGAFSILGAFEVALRQRCELHIGVKVPAGLRYRKPILSLEVNSARDAVTVPHTTVTMTYAMSSRRTTSQHVLLGPALSDSAANESLMLVDTPELTVPDCSDACAPLDLDLEVDIDIHAPEGSTTRVRRLNGELELGVEWTTCNRDFHVP